MQAEFSHLRMVAPTLAPYHVRMKLKLRIREIRQHQSLTLAELAGRAGISVPHLSEVERGVKNINNHLLTRIAEALDVKPRDLIDDDTDPEAVEFALVMESLDADDRERVRTFAQALADSRQARGPAA